MKIKRIHSLYYGFVFGLILLTAAATQAEVLAANWTQLLPATKPSARSYVAMAYDAASKKVLLFGGFGGTGYLNDTWTFDGATWANTQTKLTATGANTSAIRLAVIGHLH